MSTLEQVLAKTDSDIKINVSASQTAKTKILKKIRQGFVSCIIIAVVFRCNGIWQHRISIISQLSQNRHGCLSCCGCGMVYLRVHPIKPYRYCSSPSGQTIFPYSEYKIDDDLRRGVFHCLPRGVFHAPFPILLEL